MMFASLRLKSEARNDNQPIMCEFPGVFPEDISDFPSEREVELSIDLVPGIKLVSVTLYSLIFSQ